MGQWLEYLTHYFHGEQFSSRLEFELPFLALMFALVIVEAALVGWKKSSAGLLTTPGKTEWWDIASLFMQILGIRRIFSNLFFLGLIAALISWLGMHSLGFTDAWPKPLRFIAAFFTYDFLQYWFHRLRHENRWVWTVHEFHHSATKVNLFTSYRVHPLDYLFYFLMISIPFQLVFGLDVGDALLFTLVIGLPGYYSHSRWDVGFGWLGKYLLVSPRFHQLHHSVREEKFKNYGHALVIWDRMFGTYAERAGSIDEIEQGIKNNFYHQVSPWRAFLNPVKRFYLLPYMWGKKLFKGAAPELRAASVRKGSL